MNCALATLAACFHLSGLYVDASAGAFDAGVEATRQYVAVYAERYGTPVLAAYYQDGFDRAVLNPYGRLAVGYRVSFESADFYLEASHVSSLATDSDRGRNALMVGVRYYPFGRAQ